MKSTNLNNPLRTRAVERPPINTVDQLIKRLRSHDFWYAMSDDHRCWLAGERDRKEIEDAAKRLECEDVLRWWGAYKGRGSWVPACIDTMKKAQKGELNHEDDNDAFLINYCIDVLTNFLDK